MAQYLGTVKLGGFYNNGAALARPTKPWRNDTEPYSGAGRGNIPSMSGGISNYSFGNTPSDDAKKLQWVKIKDGDKTLGTTLTARAGSSARKSTLTARSTSSAP